MDLLTKINHTIKSFNGWDALEIICIAAIFYGILRFLKNAQAIRAAKVAGVLAALFLLVRVLKEYVPVLYELYWLLAVTGVIIFCVAFITEIRRGVLKMVSPKRLAGHYLTTGGFSDEELSHGVAEIIKAVQTFSKNNIGALIVIINNFIPQQIVESGIKLESAISAALLESIFNTKAPLHDGAVLIKGAKVLAAGCFLPLSQDNTLPQELGTRHRAALGVSEAYDVLTVIVSEETGVISTAKLGEIERYLDTTMLYEQLLQFYGLSATEHQTTKKRRRK